MVITLYRYRLKVNRHGSGTILKFSPRNARCETPVLELSNANALMTLTTSYIRTIEWQITDTPWPVTLSEGAIQQGRGSKTSASHQCPGAPPLLDTISW